MIKALIEIGKALREEYPFPLTEEPYPKMKKRKPVVMLVDLRSHKSNSMHLEFSNISQGTYEQGDGQKKYLFRNPKARGPAASLSFKLPEKDVIILQRLKILEILGYNADIKAIKEHIVSAVKEWQEKGFINPKDPVLIVLRIDGKLPAENEILINSFKSNFLNNLGLYKKKPVWKRVGICHGCFEKKTIYGGVGDLLKFYTVDKYGYAPQLDPVLSWKQYALCENCIMDLERGKRIADEFLTWNFYGKTLWVIPVSSRNLKRILRKFREKSNQLDAELPTSGYMEIEDELLGIAADTKDVLFYHFFFFQKDKQAIRVKLHLEEVLPSVISKYLELKDEINKQFRSFQPSGKKSQLITFRFFYSPYLKASRIKPGFSENDFYMLVESIFRKTIIDESYLISKAMERIRYEFLHSDDIPAEAIIETFISLYFLMNWGILKRKSFKQKGGVSMIKPAYYIEKFFQQRSDFFDHPAKKALVLLGIVVKQFIDKQKAKREGHKPFVKVLKSLKLTQKDAQEVFRALENKLYEYDLEDEWQDLREAIGIYFTEAGSKWKLSIDEIGFYIALGMAIANHSYFKNQKES